TGDIGRKKTASARDRLHDVNPHVEVDEHEVLFTSENAIDLAKPYDLLIDGTDNFPTRYLSNDVAVFLKKPNFYGSIFRFEGQATVFAPHLGGPCYRCLFPEPPDPGMVPSCAEGGVLGVLPGIVGTLQAIEAVKLILGVGEPLLGRLLHFDALAMRFRQFNLRHDPECPVCGDEPTITEPIDYQQFCGLPGSAADAPPTDEEEEEIPTIDVHQLDSRRRSSDKEFTLLDVREPFEHDICHFPEAVLIPLGELSERLAELDRTAEILVHCKAGGRSLEAVKLMRAANFDNVKNIAGGINAWSREVDPDVPLY
ncbi:MAG: ThiF family adenylyltransferase, partial [Verrucomicrobiales bacterium]